MRTTPANSAQIPVTVIGGYLGAGKTTLVNHVLRNAQGRRIAVLVNDFGDLPIDADLIEAQDDGVISIAGGCICCSFGSDLLATLQKLSARAPDHVLIEASGVALPGAVARSAALLADFVIDSVIVLADAETVRTRASDRYMADTVTRQFAEADLVVLNKTDLVNADARAALPAWLAQQAPRARIIEAVRGILPLAVLLRGARIDAAATQGIFTSARMRLPDDAGVHYESIAFTFEDVLDPHILIEPLTRPESGVLRAKGIFPGEIGDAKVLHLVGARAEIASVPAAHGPARLVCIGLRGYIDRAMLASALPAARTG